MHADSSFTSTDRLKAHFDFTTLRGAARAEHCWGIAFLQIAEELAMSRDKIQNSEQEGLTPSTGGLTSLGGSPTDSLKERGLHMLPGAPGPAVLLWVFHPPPIVHPSH